MILLSLKTMNTLKERFEKITEEYKEVKEALEIAVKSSDGEEIFINDLKHLVSELHDLSQVSNQTIIDLIGAAGYKNSYKVHLNKLQSRVNEGIIKVDEYIEL